MAFIYDLTDTWNAGGTTFNAIKMNVTDSASAAASKLVTLQVGGSERFGVRKDGLTYVAGSLGVGTSSPGATFGSRVLQVNGTADANAEVRLTHTTSGSGSADGFTLLLTGPDAYVYNRENGSTIFGTNNTERMRITAAGGLAVGTTTDPGAGNIGLAAGGRLQFSSSAYITPENNVSGAEISTLGAITFRAGSGTPERMRITDVGNVGIGTSPGDKLHVNGNIRIGGATGANYIYSTSDTLLGIQTGTGPLLFLRNNGSNESMRIDSSGRVGIGNSAPSATLTLQAANNFPFINWNNSSNSQIAFAGWHGGAGGGGDFRMGTVSTVAFGFQTNNVERMRIDSSGNVGIGTSSPGARLQINANTSSSEVNALRVLDASVGLEYSLRTSTVGGVRSINTYISVDGNTPVKVLEQTNIYTAFSTNNTERMRIDSSGNLLVGATAQISSEKFGVDSGSGASGKFKGGNSSNVTLDLWNPATSGDNVFVAFRTETAETTRGTITYNRAGGVVAYNTTSDYRAKDILGPVADPGATIDALKVYTGKMKGATIARPMLVAHEAQEVVPYAVTGEKDAVNEDGTDKYQQMDHQVLIPLLIAEIQSLRARVAQLEGN